MSKKIPSPEEVRQIFFEVYNSFYRKWINMNMPFDAEKMLQEAHELNSKYDCDLCRYMLTDLIICIQEYRRRVSGE